MIQKTALLVILFAALIVGTYTSQTDVFAQTNNGGNNPVNGGVNTNTLQTTDDAQWWWLLPLLALPIVFFLWRSADREESQYESYQRYSLAGVKGGRQRRGKGKTATSSNSPRKRK